MSAVIMATTKAAGMSGRVVLKHSPFNQTTIIRPYCVTWSEILYGRRWSSEAKTGSGPNGLLCGGPILKPAHWTRPVNGVETEAELKSLRHSLARGTPFCLRHSFLFATLIFVCDTHWRTKTAAKLGLESSLRPRGRPKRPDK